MSFLFDYYNNFEVPNIALANPDGSLLYNLGTIYDRTVKLRYNTLSEFDFMAPQYTDGILNDYYDLLEYRRIVVIEGIGNFMIVGMEISNDGTTPIKKITCQSLETELNFKKLSLFKGTFQFWDAFHPGETLIGKMLEYLPGWSAGQIDSDLAVIHLTFDVTDTTIYSFLMNEVSQSYQCIFTFDTVNKTINASLAENATQSTDIFLSYDNLVENTNIKEITDELVTALNVFGGGDLNIQVVNPLGTDTIYNFDYYMTTDWMSQALIDQILNWKERVRVLQPIYAGLLSSQITYNQIKLDQQAELALLYTAPYPDGLDSLVEVQTVRIREFGSSTKPEDQAKIKQINDAINIKKGQIKEQEDDIAKTDIELQKIGIQLKAINDEIAIEKYFGANSELSTFIIGSTYTNTNHIKTDVSTVIEIQQYSQELYDQAVKVLAKISEPRYNFEVTAANFVFLKEFQLFIDQIHMDYTGTSVVTIEFENGRFAYPALLGIDYSYDNPTDFKLTFSNRLRLDDSAFQFSDLFNQSINSGISTTFNSEQWSSWQNYSKDDVSKFITSALDASKNAIINATNQEILLDAHGLRGRYLDPNTNQYDPHQVWLINNMMAFTKDNWDSASLAIGQITNPTGGSSYGLVADVIVGRLVASNELIVENQGGQFIVSGSGAIMHNINLTIDNNVSQILLDPSTGISITKKDPITHLFTDKQFYVDALTGDVIFAGNLSAKGGTFTGTIYANSGKIGAWTIDQWGLRDDSGNNIYGDGRVSLGNGRFTISGDILNFDGYIYARNLRDYVQGTQIQNIIADTITAGTIRGINIFGCEIDWPGVRMYSPKAGFSAIQATDSLLMSSGMTSMRPSWVDLYPGGVSIGGREIVIGDPGDSLEQISFVTGKLFMNDKEGVTGTFLI
jgi:hypothetical protein